jgi:hypothetical protein
LAEVPAMRNEIAAAVTLAVRELIGRLPACVSLSRHRYAESRAICEL